MTETWVKNTFQNDGVNILWPEVYTGVLIATPINSFINVLFPNVDDDIEVLKTADAQKNTGFSLYIQACGY